MSCLSSARYGFLLARLTATALPAAPLSPTYSAIPHLIPHYRKHPPAEPTGQCFALRHIQLENVTVLPLSVQRKLVTQILKQHPKHH